jgi:uncharacterized protein (TIGR02246 family)
MQARSLLLTLPLLFIASPSLASMAPSIHPTFEDKQFVVDEKHAIERITAEWKRELNAHDPEKIAALYDEHFLLYATFQSKIDHYDALLQYFIRLAQKPELKVIFNEQNIRVFGATAVNSGLYTFSYQEEGKLKEIQARFTFVYVLTPAGWRIVEHHSSVLPE